MSQTLTDRLGLILNNPNTGEQVSIAEINSNFQSIDNDFIPAARMRSNTDQSIPNNAVTQLTYNVTDYDTYSARSEGPMVNLTTDAITIRKAAKYCIINKVTFTANATGVRRLDIVKNSVIIETHAIQGFTGANNTLYLMTEEDLAINDVITANGFQNSGGALNALNTIQGIELAVIYSGK